MNISPNESVRVRFAPSPTGMLHIGGARTAIYNWAYARAKGGSFILRIEDTDPERSTEENTQIILRALRWLGLDWDEGPEVSGEYGPYFQSERNETYAQALQELKSRNAVYPCFCTKEELDAKRAKAEKEKGGYDGYDRTCLGLTPAEVEERIQSGEDHVWRLKVPKGHGTISFEDEVYGSIEFNPDVMDDMILVRSDGSPTYNFAVVCDDINMKISHVVRGDDHLSNTPRQILIYEALGVQHPHFAHLPMILGSDGKKLSKRHGATSVEEYRDRGYLSDTLVNFLSLLGWSLDGETTIVSREKLIEHFDFNRITKKDAIFDETKLDWMNSVYIKDLGAEKWVQAAAPWLIEAGATEEDIAARPEWYEKIYPLVFERLSRLDEVPGKLSYLFWGDKVYLDEASIKKVLLKDALGAERALRSLRAMFADTNIAWNHSSLEQHARKLVEDLDTKVKLVFQPLRVAVCGNMVSPPLFESLELLERNQVIARIDQTLNEVFHVREQ